MSLIMLQATSTSAKRQKDLRGLAEAIARNFRVPYGGKMFHVVYRYLPLSRPDESAWGAGAWAKPDGRVGEGMCERAVWSPFL